MITYFSDSKYAIMNIAFEDSGEFLDNEGYLTDLTSSNLKTFDKWNEAYRYIQENLDEPTEFKVVHIVDTRRLML